MLDIRLAIVFLALVSTVQVEDVLGATECQTIPECSPFPMFCNNQLQSQVEWLGITHLGDGRYEARVDARQLRSRDYRLRHGRRH